MKMVRRRIGESAGAWAGVLLAGAMLFAPGAVAQDTEEEDPAIRKANAGIELEKANKLASRGRLAQAVPHYEKAIRLDPIGRQLAYYNVAEVLRAQEKCDKAVPYFQYYAHVTATEDARAEANKGIEACKANEWPKLKVTVEPKVDASITINGILASPNGDFGPAAMPEGEYRLKLEAVDHHPQNRTVKLRGEDATVEVKLEKMTFFGTVRVNVQPPKAEAEIRIFEGPSDETDVIATAKSPMAEAVKVREGRHFVEVTAPGYERWIRNVNVGRDDEVVVDVNLTRSKPKELQ